MHLLYLTNSFPYPLTSGYLRHYFLIRELSRRHRVTLASIVGPAFHPRHADAVAPFTDRVLTFPSDVRGRPRWERLAQQARAAVVGGSAGDRLGESISRLRGEVAFEAAVICGRDVLPATRALGGLPVVVDLCDASAVRIRRSIPYAGAIRRPGLWARSRRMARAERALVGHADHVTFVSQRDLEDVLGRTASRASVVPNGVDVEFWQRTTPVRGAGTVVFTGAMDYAPNADAALYLIDRILPQLRRVRPDVQLLIVGRDPSDALRRAGGRPGVTVTGPVPDVRPFLDRATVFAAPLRFGAGVQNKLLEAMAMAVPVVTTSLAAASLQGTDGSRPPLEVADTPEHFVDALERHLTRAEHDPSADGDGRAFVSTHFSWRHGAALMDAVLRELPHASAIRGHESGENGRARPDTRRYHVA